MQVQKRMARPGLVAGACVSLAVPRGAIHRRNNQTYVIRAESGGRREREVSLGASDASFIEITAGLREGDEVLIPSL